MLQLSEKTFSSLTKSIDGISSGVTGLLKGQTFLMKKSATDIWEMEPKKLHITINDPITVNAPKLITDGKGKDEGKPNKSFISDIKDALGMKPKSAEAMRVKAEEKQKKADARAKKRHDAMAGWFKDMGKSLKKGLTDNPIVNFIKDHWGKIMIGAMMLFLKPEQWKNIWEGIKAVANWAMTDGVKLLKGILDVLKVWVPKIAGWIGDLIDNIFGKRDKDADGNEIGNRKGGLFGEGETGPLGIIKGVLSGLALLSGALLLFGPAGAAGLAITAMIGSVKFLSKTVGNTAGALLDKQNADRARNVNKKTDHGKDVRNKRTQKIKETRAANKAKFGDARGKQGLGSKLGKASKVIGSKIGSMMPSRAPTVPTPTPAGGGGAGGLASKAGKWASKFPKLAKGMKVLSKVPHVGKVIAVGTVATMLARGASGKEIAPVLGGILGGVGGAVLGGIGGALIGGPFAPVTGLLGSVGGGLFGGIIGEGLAEWLLGMKITAMPFDWMNDIFNGKSAPEEGETPKAPAGDTGGTSQPMTKNQFLQSEKYKGEMRGADGVVAGESTAGKQMAYEEYLKEEKQAPVVKKVAKILDKKLKRPRSKETIAGINKQIDNDPNGEMILKELSTRSLRRLGRKEQIAQNRAERKAKRAARTPEQVAADEKYMREHSGSNASDDFAGAPSPMVSPTMKADTLNQVQGENAELSSGTNAIVAPTTINNITNNYGSGGEGGTAIYGVPTAQKGTKVKHSNIR